ncbi:helix-turn-helix transcriptional regulator [Photobacterium sp. SDRW27]|uniref:helix-turn-helix domain-containing protein n=1 Tax=Photobacterium obscurum TaxID=2829490 RepID=UPI002243A4BB|nr:helix-turn-helix transcriptional regulator [Photobacterium obscurum]MCW8332023.1 helix-turn-helix transcriptional regulator [Photobacterium obscurum]
MAQDSITIIPDKLKFLMADKGHTLDSLSHACSISTKQISRIRQNGRTTPESLDKIAKALECQSSELQTPYFVPQHQSWGVFWGYGKNADNDELLPENGWLMEHIQGWYTLEDSINELKNNIYIRSIIDKRPLTPHMEKREREKGFCYEISTTIMSSSDTVYLTLEAYYNADNLAHSLTAAYKPGKINKNGLIWEGFYKEPIFQYNNNKALESELLVKKIAEAAAYFSNTININNKELSTKNNEEIYLIQSIDKSSGDCIGYEEFNNMYELEVALVGYLSKLDSEKKLQVLDNSDSNEIDSNFNLKIILKDKNSHITNLFGDVIFKISKAYKINGIYQEACWNKVVQDRWKAILSESIDFNQDDFEMLCESYDLPEKTLCLKVADNISIKTVTDFINEA